MEPEEDHQRKSQSLKPDPGECSVDLCLHLGCLTLLKLECVNDPKTEVEEDKESCDLSSRVSEVFLLDDMFEDEVDEEDLDDDLTDAEDAIDYEQTAGILLIIGIGDSDGDREAHVDKGEAGSEIQQELVDTEVLRNLPSDHLPDLSDSNSSCEDAKAVGEAPHDLLNVLINVALKRTPLEESSEGHHVEYEDYDATNSSIACMRPICLLQQQPDIWLPES